MPLISIDPATNKKIREYSETTAEEVEVILQQAKSASDAWRGTDFAHRTGLLSTVANELRANASHYAEIMTEEMGKPIKEARAEAEKSAWACDYYAENGEAFLAPQTVETDASKSYVTFQPLGIVLAIMPWNFPFWQVFRFAAPALMAGNVGVLKHASNVSGCAVAIEEIFRKAGYPEGCFNTLIMGSSRVGELIDHPSIKAVTLTGSTPAGKSVAARAGAALKKTVLELGGSDPYIILQDADLDQAVAACVTGRLINTGQSCIAAKRFIVVESVRKDFEEKLLTLMKQKSMGDPKDESIDIGPMARHDLRNDLHDQVKRSMGAGAQCLLGGEIPEKDGAFYPVTVLTDVAKGMAAYEEEMFGPVASVIPVKDEAEALTVANDTPFGLGGAVFTSDSEKGEKIAREVIDAGAAFVNDFVRSDPRLPFGGVKESGYGRELSPFGIREFVNIKTVYIR
ncbi:MAG: succinate-semialdehyde dehydrogenase [Candidatus Marinimicrobia bacterium]|nr:succinate-semialdehyde dehydrogenase [Candidatus Neomarinimicrobiota bacterium]|tara:strand:- start:2014 stop:3381 length:1368 start_codon:yes stop_codon:yes gene_type:complete